MGPEPNSMLCNQCGLVFSQIRFDADEMGRIYHGYRGEEYVRVRSIFEPWYADLAKSEKENSKANIQLRQEKMYNFLSDFSSFSDIKSVLDYGGDRGQFIPSFFLDAKKFVYEISGFDAVEGVTLLTSLKELAALECISFVMCSNVLEHLPFPEDFFRQVDNIVDQNTYLFIDVPYDGADVTVHGSHPIFFHEHINYFSQKSLAALLASNGYSLLKIEVVQCNLGEVKSIFALAQKKASYLNRDKRA